jgi:geranylgeranyl reductase family protein
MPSQTTDILVVGAGPAGATVARLLAAAGRQVTIIERAPLPRHKPCGGGLPARTLKVLDSLGSEYRQAVRSRITTVALDGGRGGRRTYRLQPGSTDMACACVVDRAEFDRLLARQAELTGAILYPGCRCRAAARTASGFEVTTDRGDFRARILCVCDGASSPTARALGFARNRLGFCLEARLPLPAYLPPEVRHQAIFNPVRIRAGYAWAFPCDESFNVGIGTCLPRFRTLAAELQGFVRATPELRAGELVAVRGAMLPDFTRPRPTYVQQAAYLIGDAAGLTDPLTGEGIFFALSSARFAAESILRGEEALYDRRLREQLIPELLIARHYARQFRAVPLWLRHAGMGLRRVQRYAHHFMGILLGESTYTGMYQAMHGGREFVRSDP